MIPTLHLHLLGEFRLVCDDSVVTSVDWPRLQSLLAYLVLHNAAPQSRTHLAYLLWPNSTDAQAHSNLRTLVTRLRQTLPNADSFLRAEKQTLQWKSDAPWTLDVLDFERAVARAEHAKDAAAVRAALEEVVTLYRGDLLPACYEEWILPERERLRQVFLEALERLIVVLEEDRNYQAAIRAAQRLLRRDPLHEATYRHLMRLYAVSGDRAAALRTYHTCDTVLERELRAEPSRATREMYERLMQTEETSTERAVPRTVFLSTTPLVGRRQEWLQLQAAWRSVAAGEPHLVVLSGEAGIGKTRLAEELLAWVDRQGIHTAAARCYAAEGDLAYAPVAAWLRADTLRKALLGLPDIWLTEVARLVPDVLVERSDLPHPGPQTESWQRERLFEAFAHVIFAAHQPLLLFLDDLQWCDRETLEWIHYLLRFDPHARLLLLGTVRPEETMAGHPVDTLLTALRRNEQVTEIILRALDAAETVTLAKYVARRDLDPALEAFLYQETEGNPLFVVETIRARTLEQQAMKPTPVADTTIPPVSQLPSTVQAVIAARLAQLSSQAREAVGLAAVIGRAFTFNILAQASSGDEDALVRGLDELWQRRIVREQGGDAYDFSHDKLREGAYTALSPARRRLLHRRVFAALQTSDASSAQLAHHALHAGLREETCRYSVAAGDEAMHLFAVRDALIHYEQAQQVVVELSGRDDQAGNLSVPEVHHLYMQLGRAYELSNDYQKAHSVYESMLALARTARESVMECVALNRLATLAAWAFDMETAKALLQEALQVAERSGDIVGLAETEWNLAQTNYYLVDAQETLTHAERALALARAYNLKELLGRSLNVAAYANILLGSWKQVATFSEEARSQYAALGNRAMEADCLSALAQARINLGYPEEGIEVARAAHAICVEIQDTWGQAYSCFPLALGFREIGAYTQALEAAEQGVTIARTLTFPVLLIFSHLTLGLIQGTMFMLEDARQTMREATAFNESTKKTARSRLFTTGLVATLCMSYALSEEWMEAHACALQALSMRNDLWPYPGHFTFWYETEALVRGGDIELAKEMVQRFCTSAGEGGEENRRYRLAYLCALAVLASWGNETDQAIAHLQEAAQLSEEIGLPGERWQIEAALAELYQKRGDELQARNAFIRAAEIVQMLANAIEDAQLQKTFLSAPRVQRIFIS